MVYLLGLIISLAMTIVMSMPTMRCTMVIVVILVLVRRHNRRFGDEALVDCKKILAPFFLQSVTILTAK